MEYFDVLDENGNPKCQIKSRPEVHSIGDWHRTVHVWIINPKGQLLIQKRSHKKESHPNEWDISSAGHVVTGDETISTAIKEVREELGVKTRPEDFEHLFTVKSQNILNDSRYINNEFNDVYLVELDLDLSKIRVQKKKSPRLNLFIFPN